MVREFDDVLTKCGGYGKYQRKVSWAVVIPTSFIIAITVYIKTFQTLVPTNYWCHVPGRETTPFTMEQWKNLTIPRNSDGTFSKCTYYEVSYGQFTHFTRNIKECKRWDHDTEELHESFATANGWLCDKERYSTNLLSFAMLGNSVGTFVFPVIADLYTGRFVMFFFLITMYIVASLFMLSTSSYYIIATLFFIRGLSFQANYQTPYTIGLELVTPEHREKISFYSFAAWTLGTSTTAIIAWLIPNYVYLIIIAAGCCSILYIYYWVLDRSPRLLLSRGLIDECVGVLAMVVKTNKTPYDKEAIRKDLLTLKKNEKSSSFSLKDLKKFSHFTKNVFVLCIQSFCVFLVYVCFILNVKILPNHYYLSSFIIAISEAPANYLSWVSTKFLGRRGSMMLSMLLMMALCSIAIVVQSKPTVLLLFIVLMKIAITNANFIVYVMSIELSPSNIRSTVMGLVILCGMCGTIFSPQIIEFTMTEYYSVLGGFCGIALVCQLFIPETMGLPLPQTFPEANRIGKNVPIWKWINHWNWEKYAPVMIDPKPQ